MCLIEKINKISLIWIDLIVILISSILHTIFGFIRDLPDFNTYELFNLSPFFDFFYGNIAIQEMSFILGEAGKQKNIHLRLNLRSGYFMMKQI